MQDNNNQESKLSANEVNRYSRHLSLPEIGVVGQEKLKKSSVLCIGCGGLGSPLLMYLAAAGIGQIGIVDGDTVEESNLQRQVIHNIQWLGQPKTSSAKSQILNINPFCKVDTFNKFLDEENALEIMSPYNIICDCTDNFPSRYLINDACLILEKPNIYGSIAKFIGQVTVFNLHNSSPNYRDLVPIPPPSHLIPSCSEAGVVGVLPGIIGLIQATEVIKIITGIGDILDGRLLVYDALQMKFKELSLIHDNNNKKIDSLINYKDFCSSGNNKSEYIIDKVSVKEMKSIMIDNNEILLIDVRTKDEYELHKIPGAKSIPLNEIESREILENLREISLHRTIYLYCKSGHRSEKALQILLKNGIKGFNIIGGIDAWTNEINN